MHYRDGIPTRSESDTDRDRKLDLWITFDAKGRPLLEERDTNGDGKPDQSVALEGEKPALRKEDKNFDGKPDLTLRYENGLPARAEEDGNFDGRVERWTSYRDGKPVAGRGGYATATASPTSAPSSMPTGRSCARCRTPTGTAAST